MQRQAVLLDDNIEIPARLQALIQTHLDRAQVWGHPPSDYFRADQNAGNGKKSDCEGTQSDRRIKPHCGNRQSKPRSGATASGTSDRIACFVTWHFHQMDGIREAEPVQAGLHYLTDTDVVEPILRSHRFFLTKELTREEAHIVQQFEEEKPGFLKNSSERNSFQGMCTNANTVEPSRGTMRCSSKPFCATRADRTF